MVIPSWTDSKPSENQPKILPAPLKALPRPADRLAASIIDIFVVLMPAYLLISAPLKLQLTTSFLLANEMGIMLFILLHIVFAASLIVGYQAYMHSRFGATLGKMIFKMRVQSIWDNSNPTFSMAVKRGVFWCFDLLALGWPLLGIFTDAQRRVLHDRICNTEVISFKDHGILPPQGFEKRLVQSLTAFVILVFSGIFLSGLLSGYQKVSRERGLASILTDESNTCAQVSEAIARSPDKEITRMQMAMALYAAGDADKACLAQESEQELDVKMADSSLSYLAKAFVHSDEADISDSYLDEVCKQDPKSVECSMSELVSRWSEEDWQGVSRVIEKAPAGSVYLEVWAIRHYMKQGQVAKAMEILERVSPNSSISGFLQMQRVKALVHLHKANEADAALAQAMNSLKEDEQLRLSSWVCVEELNETCGGEPASRSCGWVEKKSKKGRLDDAEAVIGLAQLRVQECRGVEKIDYLNLAEGSADPAWKLFLRAGLKEQKDDRDSAAELFSQVVELDDAPDEIRLESLRRFLKLASLDDIMTMVAYWRDLKSGELWRNSGHLLLNAFIRRHEKTAALKVARSLMNQQALSEEGLAKLATFLDGKKLDRLPASEAMGKGVRQLLDSEEEL